MPGSGAVLSPFPTPDNVHSGIVDERMYVYSEGGVVTIDACRPKHVHALLQSRLKAHGFFQQVLDAPAPTSLLVPRPTYQYSSAITTQPDYASRTAALCKP